MAVHLTLIIMAGLIANFLIGAGMKFAAVMQQKRLDHEYRMVQHKESVEQASHKRHLELDATVNTPSDLALQTRIAEANAKEREQQAAVKRAEAKYERERKYR
jgi:hypothetical protein